MFIFKKHTTSLVYSVCTMHSMQIFLYTTPKCIVYLKKIQLYSTNDVVCSTLVFLVYTTSITSIYTKMSHCQLVDILTSPFHKDRTLSDTWITIGSHSSLSLECMMLSIALFSTSIPVGKYTKTH